MGHEKRWSPSVYTCYTSRVFETERSDRPGPKVSVRSARYTIIAMLTHCAIFLGIFVNSVTIYRIPIVSYLYEWCYVYHILSNHHFQLNLYGSCHPSHRTIDWCLDTDKLNVSSGSVIRWENSLNTGILLLQENNCPWCSSNVIHWSLKCLYNSSADGQQICHGKRLQISRFSHSGLIIFRTDIMLFNNFFLVLAKPVVMETLTSLHSLVSCITDEASKTKEIMFKSIEAYIQLSLQLFSIYISEAGKFLYMTTLNVLASCDRKMMRYGASSLMLYQCKELPLTYIGLSQFAILAKLYVGCCQIS